MKLGFMGAFVKAAADALQRVPAVNGVIDGTDIIYRDYCDISIAVATPKGLVVPVLRNADQLDFAGVERVKPCFHTPEYLSPESCRAALLLMLCSAFSPSMESNAEKCMPSLTKCVSTILMHAFYAC